MTDWKETVLCVLLDCGSADLSLLDDVDVDLYQIIDECRDEYGDTNINNVMRLIFDQGVFAIQDMLAARIAELKEQEEPPEEDLTELKELGYCDPCKDVRSYHNYLDTSVWFEQNGEKYSQHLPNALEEFERITGFSIRVN